jgi:hypothetical protein
VTLRVMAARSVLDKEVMMMTTKRFVLALALTSILLASGSLHRVRAGSGFDNSSLNGTYGFAFSGQVAKGNHPFCIGGSWNFHGDGTFDGSDTVNLDLSVTPRSYSGTYSINPDGSGSAQYTTSNGTNHTRNLEIVNQGNTVEFVQTEVDILSAGSLIKQ